MCEVKDLIGVRYKTHGRTVDVGFDCYGLVMEVMKRYGFFLPEIAYTDTTVETSSEVAKDILNKGLPFDKVNKLEEGCIIIITVHGYPSHCGVYLGDGKMIHCARNVGVVIEPYRNYERRVVGIYRPKKETY